VAIVAQRAIVTLGPFSLSLSFRSVLLSLHHLSLPVSFLSLRFFPALTFARDSRLVNKTDNLSVAIFTQRWCFIIAK